MSKNRVFLGLIFDNKGVIYWFTLTLRPVIIGLKDVIQVKFKLRKSISPKKGRMFQRFVINEDNFVIDLKGISSGQDMIYRLNKIAKCLHSDINYFVLCRIEREDRLRD